MLVLSTKWTKISLKEEFHFILCRIMWWYYILLLRNLIIFLSTLVLQYWFKLLHAWMVSVRSRTILGLVKIFSWWFSLSFYLYFSQSGEVFSSVESCLCSTVVVLCCIYWSIFLEVRLFWVCFDVWVFVSFLICIAFFRLFVPLFDLYWRFVFSFFCLHLVYGWLFVTRVYPE